MTQASQTNALAAETSPYLQQHASNPVDWQPWGEAALVRARQEDKPILLSVGYSACHWCHVMAHESFEDTEIAELMNRHFINIKVDREERPDLDKIYQTAHQLLTHRPGGWPLTMFLMPTDHVPFFAGTYFPKQPRFGMPSFPDVLGRIADVYRQHRGDIERQSAGLKQALAGLSPPVSEDDPGPGPLGEARTSLDREFDDAHGGFGGAPKFPQPTLLNFLLRHHADSINRQEDDERGLEMAVKSLHAMSRGGLYDHVGGGFYRYSVDEHWTIPHFEKMLYDNALLLPLYAQAWQINGDEHFRQVAKATGEWVLGEMQSSAGGYFSTLDADSEGEEGKFYVWSPDSVSAELQADSYAIIASRFGLDRPPNFEGRHWHLREYQTREAVARQLGQDEAALTAREADALKALYASRKRRPAPSRDEKILVSWNGLMIRGMAVAGRILGLPEFVASAEKSVDFLRAELWQEDRLLACWKDQRARFPAYLDDYAFLTDALLELLQARWRDEDLAWLVELADGLLAHFFDETNGGFFFTAHDHEDLIHRPKPFSDDALPAGNAVAASSLYRLGHLLGEPRYLQAAEKTLRAGWEGLRRHPSAHGALLGVLEEQFSPAQTIVIRGTHPDLGKWAKRCHRDYAPLRQTFAIPADAAQLPGHLALRTPKASTVAYVCTGLQCQAPISDLDELGNTLQRRLDPSAAKPID